MKNGAGRYAGRILGSQSSPGGSEPSAAGLAERPEVAAPPLPALGRSLPSAALPCLGLLEQQAAECHFLSLPEWHFLAGSPQLPPVVPELRAHGSVWLCPPPTAAWLHAFAGRTRPAAGSPGGFRSVSRRSGAWEVLGRVPRGVDSWPLEPPFSSPGEGQRSCSPLRLTPPPPRARRPPPRPLQLPAASQPSGYLGSLSWTSNGLPQCARFSSA